MHVTHRCLTLLALIVPTTLAGCDVPCGVEIVQADVTRSAVRVRNTCEGEIDSSPLVLCSGPSYSDDCTPFPQTMKAGECVEFPVWDLPQEYKGAFGVGIFQLGKDPQVTPPIDNLIIGSENTSLVDPDGVIRKPDALSITFGYSLTLARYGWWYPIPSTPQPISCFTWAHTIKVSETSSCDPQLVEVHPGDGTSYLKLSLRPYCDDVDLSELRVGYGVNEVESTLPLPSGTLAAGTQLVVGNPHSSDKNGYPQWSWPGMSAGSVKVADLESPAGIVVLYRDKQIVSGVAWGASSMLGVQHADAPTPGRSLVWTGDEDWFEQWKMAPSSPNQLPRWHVAGVDPEPVPPTPEELQKLAANY